MNSEYGKCPRNYSTCTQLRAILSDDKPQSFVCCGLSDPMSRANIADIYRLCFKTAETDTIYDHDELDLLDIITVIAGSMAIKRRLEDDIL